jgi:hypothetical protein
MVLHTGIQKQATQPITYLGFPLYFHISQRNAFVNSLTEKFEPDAIYIHSETY